MNNQAQSGQLSLGEMLNKLTNRAKQNNEQSAQGKLSQQPQTLADDAPIQAEKGAQIQREEALVRKALALFGVDYDALITPDGNSVYAQAVKANPRVAEAVLAAESPVLAALEIAAKFKPYAEFMEKYGSEPEQIRAAIRAELSGEQGAQKHSANPKQETAFEQTPFSGNQRVSAPVKSGSGPQALHEIFNT